MYLVANIFFKPHIKMNILKFLTYNRLKIFAVFFASFFLLQSCKVYQDPISLNEAANNTNEGYYKVTMNNGDEYIYEKIELNNDNNYIGFTLVDKKPTETILNTFDIKSIQKQNKKSSGFSNVLGIGVGVGSIILGVLMFGN